MIRESDTGGLQTFKRLVPLILLFWLFFFLRLHEIGEWLPFFIDELHHIDRARRVWEFSDLQTSTTPGKILLYYWISLFDLPPHLPGWLARTAVAIIVMLGAAGTFALAKTLFSRAAGYLAMLLLIFFPFMLFHERMVLTDPVAASFVVLLAWWSVVSIRRPSLRKANILAVIMCLMVAAKLHAFPMMILPVLAMLCFAPTPFQLNRNIWPQIRDYWEHYRPYILRAGIIVGVVWGIVFGFYVARGLTNPDDTDPIVIDSIYAGLVDDYETTTLDVIDANLTQMREIFTYLWGYLLTGVGVVATVYLLVRHPYRALFLLFAILALSAMVAVVAARPNSRYYSVVGPLYVVLIVGGLMTIGQDLKSRFALARWLPGGLILLWIGTFGLPFAVQMIDDPTQLELPERETTGYFRNRTGYGLEDALIDVTSRPPISDNADMPVFFANVRRPCEYFDYSLPSGTEYIAFCYDPWEHENRTQVLNRGVATYGTIYVLLEHEERLYFDQQATRARLQWLATYERPHDGIGVSLFIAHPSIKIGGHRPSPDE